MTLAELRAEGQRLYSEVEAFCEEGYKRIGQGSHDFVTISYQREELNRKQAEMLMTNARRFETLVEAELKNRPGLEKLLRACCADFLRTRAQMSEIGKRFFNEKVSDFF